MGTSDERLTRTERTAVALARICNETGPLKRLQWQYHWTFSRRWVGLAIRPRVYVVGAHHLLDLDSDKGVLQASNHRSFFDQYIEMLVHFDLKTACSQNLYFPVRANFFYEKPLGMLINTVVGAHAMYPPIFRQRDRADLNKDSLRRLTEFLQSPDTLVGIHPEGTRGKGPDPYEMLPAQPGIGQVTLQAQPVVIPCFINGLSNDFVGDFRSTYQDNIRRTNPVIIVHGAPMDYSEFTQSKPRLTLYKKCADKIRAEILKLSEQEKDIRAACARGEISDDDPGWLENLRR